MSSPLKCASELAGLTLAFILGGSSASAFAQAEATNDAAYSAALQAAFKMRQEHEALQRELYDAQRERFELKQPDADKKQLAESEAKVKAAFAQAAKLAGDREAVALQKIKDLRTKKEMKYPDYQAQAEACGQFADEFPYSAQAEEMLKEAFYAYFVLGRYLRDERLRRLTGAPTAGNPMRLALEHQLAGLRYLAALNTRKPIKGTNGGSTSVRFPEELKMLYPLGPTAEQVADVHARYGMIFDERPDLAPHSDFYRLDYLIVRNDKEAYLKLLGQMQSRWPPDSPHWQFTAGATLRQLCDLVQSDPRGTNFYWWLRGKREIGELP